MKFYTFIGIVAAITAVSWAASAAEDGIVCPAAQADTDYVVQFPSPSDCGVFYKCNRGVAHKNLCPAGLHYNKRIKACDFPLRANCQLENANEPALQLS